ncbi:MAG: hypothetical protein DLM69_07155 [Candidatus Chloroheliales bacterium]|nr:MAG: hypothetical protein DLM69_07155 [Chloroflexota bacterium]
MFRVSESAIIDHPPSEVFSAAADPHKQLEWDPATLKSVEQLTPGPLRQGARYRGNFKGFGVMEYEFVEFEPGRRFTHRTIMKMGEMRHTFTFEPVATGTRLTQEGQLNPNLLGWLMGPLMTRMLRKRFREIAAELRQYLATATTPGQPT